MKYILLNFLIASLLLTSCNVDSIEGSTTVIKKEHNLKDFDAIDISSAFELEIVQSDEYRVELLCNDNIEEFIDIELNDNTLIIGLDGNHSFSNATLQVIVHAPSLHRIEASGATKIHFGEYKIDNFTLDLSGASNIEGKFIVSKLLEIEASGASEMKLRGKAKNAIIDLSGASELTGKKLKISDNLNIDASGASSITITANGIIEIDISGASDVKYYGSGIIVQEDVSGAGSIEKK